MSRWLLALCAVYALTSVATFALYAFDKSAAIGRRRRVSERTLHLWALLGGWPGALAAQRLLRHKSSKRPFRAVFWLTVLANVAAVAWLWPR